MDTLMNLLSLVGSLGLFLYGMKIMSEGLQKVAGDRLRSILAAMTKNRVMGVFTGILITAAIQSSSATTVMVVSFVNAGLMTLAQSIGVIMGANVGTTVTAWIISIIGFKMDIALWALPMLALGLPLIFSGKSSRKSWGEFIFGFSFLFMGLSYLQRSAEALNMGEWVANGLAHFGAENSFLTIIVFVIVGALVTMVVQASAATMAITLMLFDMHIPGFGFEQAAALAMGQNIGTTITANLADDLFKLSMFHTAFNVFNVLLLIWFVKTIERIVCVILPMRESEEEYRLRFISRGLLSTAELSILEARKEIHLFAERTHRMFGMVRDLLHTEKDDDFNTLFSRIEKYENISDSMELEIANYLNKVSEGRLSSESKLQIRSMLREVTEIESIGDSCYNLARTISRRRSTNQEFSERQYEHIHSMMKLVDEALVQMILVVERNENQQVNVNKSFNLENEINNYRNQLKNQNIVDVNNKEYDYQMGVYYMDIIAECEKLGDYVVNVVEASSDQKEKKAS